jgi:hypothetical protein
MEVTEREKMRGTESGSERERERMRGTESGSKRERESGHEKERERERESGYEKERETERFECLSQSLHISHSFIRCVHKETTP